MRKLLALSLSLAAACGGSASFQDQARDALPDKDGVQVGPQQAQSGASSALYMNDAGQQATTASVDTWYAVTVAFAATINGATAWTLGVVEAVTNLPPTSCTPTSCTWGPGSNALDPNTYQLIVSQGAAGSFDWELDAQSKTTPTAPFSKILFGNAVPSGQRHRGSGTFTIDLNAAAALSGHSTDQGTIVISYSNVGPAHITAHFNGVKDSNPAHAGQIGNAYYNFQQDITGGGDLEIAWHNLTSDERDDIHSRWKVDGSGRSDVTVITAATQVSLSDCWSSAATGFQTVFSASVGQESACSFIPAAPGSHINDAP
jgi:hypothetical protein